MFSPALLLITACAVALPKIENGAQFAYRGSMLGVKGEAAQTRKLFDLSLLVAESDEEGLTTYWTLEERGRGGFAWPDRLGRWRLNAQGKGGDTGPALLYDRGDGLSVVPLHTLFLATEKPLVKGLSWSEGKLESTVAGEEKSAGRDCWRVEVRNQYGPKRVLWIDKERPQVVALTETVFIGQGVQFDLRLELIEAKTLPEADREKSVAAFDELLKVRDNLRRPPRTERGDWTDAQLKILKAKLPTDLKLAAESPLVAVYKSALADVNDQKGRSSAVAALREKIVGAPVGELKLEDLSGRPVSTDDLKGNITVLHFWDYKDSPLEEPYGQVGYLDFLYRKRKEAGVRVYGVAVDPRVGEPDQRRAAVAGVKRFQAFMNLNYPLLLDAGPALKQLGDPRPTGAKLPVFVVLDASGKVVLYQVGHFEVHRDRGLEELDTAVTKALGK